MAMNIVLGYLVLFLIVAKCWCCSVNGCNKISLQYSHSEDNYLQAIKCHHWCLKQYRVELPPVLDTYPVWPSLNNSALTANCHKYQKVEICRLGCLVRFQFPSLTTNKCRDNCSSRCHQSCGGKDSCSIQDSSCQRKCRRTYCRKGCEYFQDNIQDSAPSSPLSPPILQLLPSSKGNEYYYSVKFPESGIPHDDNITGWVNFLFKVSDLKDGVTRYYWQTDLTQPLRLSAFVCREIRVSMAVVTYSNHSDYSPQAILCVYKGYQYPSQVNANQISLKYQEDTRSGYLGYAIIFVSWEKPQGHEFLSSYSLHVLSAKPECGGKYQLYSFEPISQSNTSLVIQANQPTNFPRFGCEYHLKIMSYPSNNNIGTQIVMNPKLMGPAPHLELNCSVLQGNSNSSLDISMNWTIADNYTWQKTIQEFQIKQIGLNKTKIYATTQSKSYIVRVDDPINEPIQLMLTPIKNPKYFWRLLPYPKTCIIPPRVLVNITSDNVTLNVTWAQSMLSTHIELCVNEGPTTHPPHQKEAIYHEIIEANLSSISLTIQELKRSCLFLWVRTWRHDTANRWGDPLLINKHCKTNKRACNSTVETRLTQLEEKLDTITEYWTSNTTDSLNGRLQAIEQKLDNLINLVTKGKH